MGLQSLVLVGGRRRLVLKQGVSLWLSESPSPKSPPTCGPTKMSDFRTYQTERQDGNGGSYMFSKLAQGDYVGEIVGKVHYSVDGAKSYSVLSTLV